MASGTHKIPQNVTQYEGRIIGKFTAKQFVFLAVGLIGGFVLFNTPLPVVPKVIAIAVVVGISIIFSLANVQGKTTDAWISGFMKAVSTPTQRVWKKREFPPAFLLPSYHVKQAKRGGVKTRTEVELERFIQLWSPVNPSNDFTKEEQEILARVQEHGGLASQSTPQLLEPEAQVPTAQPPN